MWNYSEYGGGHLGRGGALADVGIGGAGLGTGTMWPAAINVKCEKLFFWINNELSWFSVNF